MRSPVVAGQFYPGTPDQLQSTLEAYFSQLEGKPEPMIGGIVPHAGYIYSGGVAATVFARTPQAETYIILGPNHRGMGYAVAASREDWRTPLGDIKVDTALVDALPGDVIAVDETAHRYEHSIEVQLPFLQYLYGDGFMFMPISMALQDEETAMEVGDAIVGAIQTSNREVIILASSDFTHYEPDEIARNTDNYVIESILRLDVDEMYSRLRSRNASVCGYGPIAVLMHASKMLGATEAELTMYATSGDVSGDISSVVGYAGIVIR